MVFSKNISEKDLQNFHFKQFSRHMIANRKRILNFSWGHLGNFNFATIHKIANPIECFAKSYHTT
jgi:hypothetical protein